jgi:hypothetical protein
MRNYGNSPPMKLQQNQVWRQGDRYLRIVQLQRMSVDYKLMQDPAKKEGSHHHATKKDFCRLLKGATLVSAAGVRSVTGTPPFRNESVDAPSEPADTSMP